MSDVEDESADKVTVFREVTEDAGFHAWAESCVEDENAYQMSFETAPFGGLPLFKGQKLGDVRLELGDKVYMLKNVVCIRGLEHGMSEIKGMLLGLQRQTSR